MTKISDKKCTSCGEKLTNIGKVPFRTDGPDGFVFMFRDLMESDERLMEIDLFRCINCGHLEMFDLDFSIPVRE